MMVGNIGTAVLLNDPSHLMSPPAKSAEVVSPKPANMVSTKVELSPAGISLSQKEASGVQAGNQLISKQGDTEKSDGIKSFAYGALGMDHPDKVGEEEDDSYSAGQFLKAAATVGSVIALFI